MADTSLSTVPGHGKLAGKTVAFVGKFEFAKTDLDALEELTIAEGGSVVDGTSSPPDYLVVGAGSGRKRPPAAAQMLKKHPQVQVVDEAEFFRFTLLTPGELLAIMKAGPPGGHFWYKLQWRLNKCDAKVDLSGSRIRPDHVRRENNLPGGICLPGRYGVAWRGRRARRMSTR